MKTVLQSVRMFAVVTLLTGVAYPLAMTAFAKVAFRRQAEGSLIEANGIIVGSELLAQKFESDAYFWPRPSAGDYATVASGASNKGPTSANLAKSIEAQRTKFGPSAPVDLLTSSASGLDPHISPEGARAQIVRIAKARQLPVDTISAAVDQAVEPPQLGWFGEPRVNVLNLNRALDGIHSAHDTTKALNDID